MLFGRARNSISFLSGNDKRIVEIMIAAGVAGTVGRQIIERGIPPAELMQKLRGMVSLNGWFDNNKYAYFNGRIFVDCFAPGWPGKAFGNMAGFLVRNLGRKAGEWEPYISSLVLSITKKCVYRCEHCYAIKTLGSSDVLTYTDLLRIVKDFQSLGAGVGVVAWEGGEPLLRFDELLRLIRATRDRSESMLATTAYGLTNDMAQRLREAGLDAAIISIDHYEPDRHNAFRRNEKAFDMAVNGVRIFRENGILPSIAICATREVVDEGGLWKYLDLAKEIGAAFVQIIDATPSGNYIGHDVILKKSQMEEIKKFHIAVNTDPRYRDYPAVQARALLEDENYNGCCAANALAYIDSSGNMQPCDLLQISFGNVIDEGVEPVYRRMKACFPHPTKGRCPAQTLSKQIHQVHNETGALPVDYKDCQQILETISARGLPPRMEAVRQKLHRG